MFTCGRHDVGEGLDLGKLDLKEFCSEEDVT